MAKKDGQKWKVDIRPDGIKGKRVIRLFDTKAEANYFERLLLSGRIEPKGDNRRLSELVNLWYDLHGRVLNSSLDTKSRLLAISKALNDPVAFEFSVSDFSVYRQTRVDRGIQPATLNRELQTLKAVFRELKRLSVIDYESPVQTVRKLKQTGSELSYLTDEQITLLSDEVKKSRNSSLYYVVMISLATGARWSEAESLIHTNCRNGGFYFVNTKNGQSRFVPVEPFLFDLVFQFLQNQPFQSCHSAFRSALKRTGIKLPSGQLAHVLRHTFASHYVMKGGNLKSLQQLLGHSSLTVTMRYAHLSPDFHDEVRQLNPLSGREF
ncbi:phage integrase [Methylomonas rivi]|uniref:Tyrosine-type recombinase/integrase n=1 Tax=Methylomonas rivi TaxID=2952226 RepID=A0ABT1UA11_9GAMM|nr:tyrosine-type recombinase/integrase [Methylomonas sp. WSC-6]MCQ8130696.1 tyrosine-type recombinase/integrase [Methylomonas sp. WSC-6]